MKDQLEGGVADNLDFTDLAQKYNMPLNHIIEQLEKGAKIEKEHTNDEYLAQEIAKDHLSEDLNYYTKLQNMEKTASNLMAMPEELKKDTELIQAASKGVGIDKDEDPNNVFVYTGSFDNYCKLSFNYLKDLFKTYVKLGNFDVQDAYTKELNEVMFSVLSNHSNVINVTIEAMEQFYNQYNNAEEKNNVEYIHTQVIEFFVWMGALDESEIKTQATPEEHIEENGELNTNEAPIGYKLHNYNINKKKEGINMEQLAKEAVWGKQAENSELNMKIIMLNEAIEDATSIDEIYKIYHDMQIEVNEGIFSDKDIDPEVNRAYMRSLALLNTKADELEKLVTVEANTQLNSNTYLITKESEDFSILETTIKKIAEENNIENVEKVTITASPNNVTIQYKIAKTECSNDDKKDDKNKKKEKDEKKNDEKKKKDKDKKTSEYGETNIKIARNPQLEQKLYQGSLTRTELEELKRTLLNDVKNVQPNSQDYIRIKEQLQMITQQLQAENSLDKLKSDSYSFAE